MLKSAFHIIALLLLLQANALCQDNKVNTDLSLLYLVQLPAGQPAHAPVIILLHGMGSNEADLFSLRGKFPKNYLIVSARAPYSIGDAAYQWFNMITVDGKPDVDPKNMENSRALVTKFITEVVNKYKADAQQVYLMGFSQGAMMSYEVGLTAPDKLKGIGVLSGTMVRSLIPLVKVTPALKQLKIFIGHGTADERISIDLANMSNDYLKGIGLKPEFHTYPNMPHQINEEELGDLMKWLAK